MGIILNIDMKKREWVEIGERNKRKKRKKQVDEIDLKAKTYDKKA